MKKSIAILSFVFISFIGFGQTKFKTIIDLGKTSIKNQQRTGTCWSFASASFIESEILRIKNKAYDLSEMYSIRNIYEDKAKNYYFRQGKANFSEGALSHDFINQIAKNGLVPEDIYPGKPKGEEVYNHTELFKVIEAYMKAAIGSKLHTDYWYEGYSAILDVYFGEKPESFIYEGEMYTPQSFAKELGIEPKNYIELTSFTHHPFNKYFVLEIPDNYSSGYYYNVDILSLKNQTDWALENGYTVSWDGDVSEKGFGRKTGIIKMVGANKFSLEDFKKDSKTYIENRQKQFEKLKTTDDHLMHIVGKAEDENGKLFYIVKNSWGKAGEYEGIYYMSEPYFIMKTIAITIHKDALMDKTKPAIYLPDAVF